MKNILLIFFLFLSYNVVAQQRFPVGAPTQFSTGYFKQGYHQSDSGTIIANRDTNWLAKYSATIVFKPSNKQFYWFDSTTLRWNQFGTVIDTTSLSNRINLKQDILSNAGVLGDSLLIGNSIKRLQNDYGLTFSTNATKILMFIDTLGPNHVVTTSQLKDTAAAIRSAISGGSGLTSVGLSMPSAFSVVNSPLTSNGTISVSGAGTSSQYIRGNGTLATTDTGMIPNFYLKVRGLISGVSPITFNQTTGIIGIQNADVFGAKGAATFNNADFASNGSGLISLSTKVTGGSCTNCTVTFGTDGRATAYSTGVGPSGSSVDSIWRTPGVDSIYFAINSVQYAIKDSAGATITASNGLTKIGNDIRLGASSGPGAPLINDTYIDAGGFIMSISGSNASNGVFGVSNSSGGYAIDGTSSSATGAAIHAFNSAGGIALSSEVTAGKAAYFSATTGLPLYIVGQPVNANGNTVMAEFHRQTSGTASAGISQSFDYWSQLNDGTNDTIARLKIVATNATAGSQTGAYDFLLKNNAVSLARKARLQGDGRWIWDGYAATTFQTVDTSMNTLVVDGSGNIYKRAGGDGGHSDTVFSTHIAYVDTLGNDATGVVNNPAKPFKTINAALDALPSWGGKIEIGIGEFMVPDTAKIKSNIWFAGSGMPHYDDTVTVVGIFNNSTPTITKMIGGTILHGFFLIPYNRNNVDMSDLGVDNGSAWINAHNGGTALDCVGYAQLFGPGLNSADGFHLLQTSANPRTGIDVQNVSTLVKEPSSLVHGFIFENMINPNVDNIYSCYGFAGIVIKSMYGVYTNLHAQAHSDAGIYLKSNDYSYCYGVVVSGFEIKSVGSYDGGGVHLNANDAGSPGLYECSISNGIITQTTYGMKSMASANVIDGININNVKAVLSQGDGFNFPVLYYSIISNSSARACGGDGFNLNGGGGGKGPFLSDCISASNGGDGFEVNGVNRINLENVSSENNAGYGIRSVASNLYIGLHSELNNTLGATTGTLNTNLIVSSGGTGNLSFTPYALIAGGVTSTGALQQVSGLGTAGQVLTSNGAGALPSFQNAASGGITTLNTLTASTQTFATGTSGTDFNISSSTSTHTFNIPSASTSNRGLVTTTSQTIGGLKTFNDGVYVTNSSSTGRLRLYGDITSTVGPSTSGTGLQLEQFTYTDNGSARTESGLEAIHLVGQPTITSSNAITYSGDAVTFRVNGAPFASGSMTLSHPWAVYANDVSQFDAVAFKLNEQSGDATIGSASNNIYSGTGGNTWTLPSLATHPGKMYFIKNIGSGNLTIQRGGSDNIYTTSSVTSFTVAAGAAVIIVATSSYWVVE